LENLAYLREYGSFFGTHRIFRHYVYAIFAPYAVLKAKQRFTYYRHFEVLNHTHANRFLWCFLYEVLEFFSFFWVLW